MRSTGYIVLALLAAVVLLFTLGKRLHEHRASAGNEAAQVAALPHGNNLPANSRSTGAIRVIDGDTIAIGEERIRLFGIDAPEEGQPCELNGQAIACGYEAGRMLEQLIGEAQPNCIPKTTDRYGRTVAVCSVNGKDLGREMVTSGWAVAFVRYSQDYVADEAAARSARRGMWQGEFERPQTWRAEHR